MTDRLVDRVGYELRQVANEIFMGGFTIRVISPNHLCMDFPQHAGPDMHIGCILDPGQKTAAVIFHELVSDPIDLVLANANSQITRLPHGVRIEDIGTDTREKAAFIVGAYLGLGQF